MSETIKLCAMVVRHDQSEWSDETRELWVAQACRARDEHDSFRKGERAADAEIERLRAENARLQVNLRKFSELVTSITGELDWFKRRERECDLDEYVELEEWEANNPKPEAGT